MIVAIYVFAQGFAKCEIMCQDRTKVEISIPEEALKGLSVEERTAKIMERGNAYIAAQCPASEPTDERSVATEAK